jgi:hypothetical protein
MLITMVAGLVFHVRRRKVIKLRSNLDAFGSPAI